MGNFSDEDIKYAQEVQEKYGVPASVTLAQYALESGYGKSTVGENNYFNIKGNGNGGYANYSSKEESFLAYGALLSKDRYTSQTADATTVEEYVQGVKDAGYAEDPNYVSKVTSIIDKNNLTQYDTGTYQKSSETGMGNAYNLKWWGDIVIVVFAILLLVGGVAFIGFAVVENGGGEKIKSVKKVVKAVK